MTTTLSAATVSDLVATLQYLKRQFEISGSLDEINAAHTYRALARVEIDRAVTLALPPAATKSLHEALVAAIINDPAGFDETLRHARAAAVMRAPRAAA